MCFTPLASLITAIIEFLVAGYLFYKLKKKFYPLAFFVLFLGIYQFTEFMLCGSQNPFLWARLGFIAYSFLPLLVHHFFITTSKLKFRNVFYLIPISFSILSLTYPNFILSTSCNYLHVSVQSFVFNESLFLMFFYLLYYAIFPISGFYFFLKTRKKSSFSFKFRLATSFVSLSLLGGLIYYVFSSINGRNPLTTWTNISVLLIASALLLVLLFSLSIRNSVSFCKLNSFVLATTGIVSIVLYYLVPNLTFNYSSIYCQFALLYALSALLLSESIN